MINERYARAFCNEDISKIENYKQAVNDKTQTWHCHHRRETDKNMSKKALISKGLYLNRPAAELIFLTKSEHTRLHGLGEKNSMFGKHHSEETKKKMSIALIGKHHSEETKKKISIALSGKHLSAEMRKKLSNKIIGMKYWNNGTTNKRSKECPGRGWVRGRLKRKNHK